METLQNKIEAAKAKLEEKRDSKGKYRKLTITERCGFWTISWVIFWAVLAGAGWTYTINNMDSIWEAKTVTVFNASPALADTGTTQEKFEDNEAASAASVPGEFLAYNAEEITKVVYELETNSGKNGTDQGCHAKGLHNGYGFAPGSCYESDAETGKLVEKWFEKQLKTKTLAQSLCFYNMGKVLDDCDYYQNYLKIK